MSELYLDDILGIDPNIIPTQGEDDLLQEEPLKASREEVARANAILTEQLHREVKLPHDNYKKFDPLNQKLSTNFNQPDFSNPHELVEKIDLYFREVEHPDHRRRIEPSTASFAMHLNVSRKMLNSLEEKPVYGPIISAAKTRIESYLASRLVDGRPSTSGVALVLKNDFDWREKQELTGELTFSVTRQMFSDPNVLPAAAIEGEVEDA